MFETLQDLLDAIAALSAELTDEARAAEVRALCGPDHVDPENLATWLAEARESAEGIIGGELTDDSLALLGLLREATVGLSAEQDANTQAAEDRQAEAQRLAAEIRGSDAEPGDGDGGEDAPGEGEGDDGAGEGGDGGGDGTETPAEGGDDEQAQPGTPAEGEQPTEDRQAVAASAESRRRQAIRAAAMRPRSTQVPGARGAQPGELPSNIADWGLVASANVGNMTAGSPIRTLEDLSEAVLSAVAASRNYTQGPPVNVPLFRIGGLGTRDELRALGYDDDRILDRDYIANQDRIARACSPEAMRQAGGFDGIQAAGGICAPQQVNYDQPTAGDDGRPVRDQALVRFGAERGGVRLFPPVLVEDVEAAIGVWTAANDADPGSDGPATKPCLTLTCPEDQEELVVAITRCLEIGNFRSRFFGEQVEAWVRLAGIAHARVADSRLFSAIIHQDVSTQVTAGQHLGALPDLLATMDLATAALRDPDRIAVDVPLRWLTRSWVMNMLRADQARSMPAGTFDERFALSDEMIRRALAVRGVTPTFALDGPDATYKHDGTVVATIPAGQQFARQGDGPLQGWPSVITTALYPDGSHLFLDGGQLDLGIVRDSGLNSTNDFQMFAETFEGHAFQGHVSYRLDIDLCPSGTRSELDAADVCTTGS